MANLLHYSTSTDTMQERKITTYDRSSIIRTITSDIAKLQTNKEYVSNQENVLRKIDNDIAESKKLIEFLESLKSVEQSKTDKFNTVLNDLKEPLQSMKNGGKLRNTIEKMISSIKGNCLVNRWYVNKFKEIFDEFKVNADEFNMDTGASTIAADTFIKNKVLSVIPDISIYLSEIIHIYRELDLYAQTQRIRNISNENISVFSQPPGTKSAELWLTINEYIDKNLINFSSSPEDIKRFRKDIERFRGQAAAMHEFVDKDTKEVRDFLAEINNCLRIISDDFLDLEQQEYVESRQQEEVVQ